MKRNYKEPTTKVVILQATCHLLSASSGTIEATMSGYEVDTDEGSGFSQD